MGHATYSVESRTLRASELGYATKSVNEIFTQNTERRVHDLMNPKTIIVREARDSQAHPNVVPIILNLDLTGSMGHIPHDLIKDGLPKMIGGIIQKGIADPALLFVGIGDHECDSYPLQVGQFESGDLELDTWLTRTYIEKGGGGNEGESYLLAWYFASKHTAIDSFEKRGQKGFLFTIGDEPTLNNLPFSTLKNLMDHAVGQGLYSADQLLVAAQEKYHVYHLHIMEGSAGRRSLGSWKRLLGQNCIQVDDYRKVAEIITDIVVSNTSKEESFGATSAPTENTGTTNPVEEML